MGPPVIEILSHQAELAARAREATEGANEASLLVGQVVCRALGRFDTKAHAAEISAAMSEHLDDLIAKALRAQHYSASPRFKGSGRGSPEATNDSDIELMQ